MKKILLFISDGFEEIEAVSIIDICRRADITVDICSIDKNQIKGSHNIIIEADFLINELKSIDSYDMLVLPGGMPNADNLAKNTSVQNFLRLAKDQNKYIAAICAAPYALHTAGVLNKNYTCFPSFENRIRKEGYIDNQNVVIDENIITSKGPSTAIEFSLILVKVVTSSEVYNNVKIDILF
ncbi:MAG: DJ-1/PfpI family protein [Campylobacterales bacterium]|nr:DJ-1/PfpI family protein [Campylobacterales bacterium]